MLDFSSGSEEDKEKQGIHRKTSKPSTGDGNRDENSTGPGRMSLRHHGFSRLLERIKGKVESRDGDSSPGVGESPFNTDSEDHEDVGNREDTSSGIHRTGNGAVCLPKMTSTPRDISNSSGKEDNMREFRERQKGVSLLKESDDTVKKIQDLGVWKNTKVDVESDENTAHKLKTTVPVVDQIHGYSEESEDFDLEASRKEMLLASGRVKDSGRRSVCHRRRQSASVRNKARSKYKEDIETFTSSEDEHTPVKRGRSSGCLQTERSTVDMPKDGPRATTGRMERPAAKPKAVLFTCLKGQMSPAAKGGDWTIDRVLGQIQ